jgi:pyruvate ferredoxin oxidoreductase gamma subunit
MVEIRINGRGGQGNVVSAYILAQAAFASGRFVQAFPSFGPERRGAPVAAFVRISDLPIRRHCQVLHPAFLIMQDEALIHVPHVTEGLRPGGGVLINSAKAAGEFATLPGCRIVTISATRLGEQFLGRPIPNTALLAAFVALTGLLPLEALDNSLSRRFRDATLANNQKLVHEAASRVDAGAWKDIGNA